ncbi:MAG: DNA repair protein RadC [Oscillospiraceae bacterium]|nr:DNA repair protein RadC [Oscillospiraceae bacterium]MBQ3500158.1 DNA repair protein RadC [Oscillospiraceae bacterium]MBQ4643978.1 DNA repair protein RadC [Oscillospiraceae bacterium]
MPSEHDGHRKRLKARFVKSGLDDFEPHNVLELLLFYGIPRKDTNPTAHKLINRFGSLSAVFDARPEELMKVDGITENTAVLISMIPQLARKYLEDKSDAVNAISGFDDIGTYLMPKFVGRTVETIMLAALDNKNKIISCSIIAEGENDRASLSKRKVMEEAIRVGATRVVLAHNHPRGFAMPSKEDIHLTEEVYALLRTVEIELVDHIIFAEDDFVSLAASGIDFRRK